MRVPVLSNSTAPNREAASIASPPRNSRPERAASPEPTVMAVGVAKPKAQGQATTNTEMANCKAKARGVSALDPSTPWAMGPISWAT